nr:potassium channel subfamily K member 10-like [Lepeophtheirus salmonis]
MQSTSNHQFLDGDEKSILLDNFKKSKLVTVLITSLINFIYSFTFALIFVQLEAPNQNLRIQANDDLQIEVLSLRNNFIKYPTFETFLNYSSKLKDLSKIENTKEISWDMLSAFVFVSSIHSTTGYGNIVPQTLGGKVCATVYAIFGIPMFVWYIIQLRDIFRILLMRVIYGGVNIFRKLCLIQRENDNVIDFRCSLSDLHKMETRIMFKKTYC